MPRVPLPDVGITFIRETCTASSEDITPRSSLLRTHSPIPCGSPLLRLLASFEESVQVATSPCCHRDLPDVISANLSCDAWAPTPTVPRSAFTCCFLCVIGLPQERLGRLPASFREHDFSREGFRGCSISLCSGLTVCSPPRSLPPLRSYPQGGRDFYVRAERASLPPHAPDMLAVRKQAIDGTRTFTPQDPQSCRLLPPVYASSDTSRCPQQDSRSGWIRYFLSCRGLAPPTTCRFIPALSELAADPTGTTD